MDGYDKWGLVRPFPCGTLLPAVPHESTATVERQSVSWHGALLPRLRQGDNGRGGARVQAKDVVDIDDDVWVKVCEVSAGSRVHARDDAST
eukprot:3199124-Rhodomonas_salina.1